MRKWQHLWPTNALFEIGNQPSMQSANCNIAHAHVMDRYCFCVVVCCIVGIYVYDYGMLWYGDQIKCGDAI